MADQSETARYMRALIAGNHSAASLIEERHGLYGYPPELVSIGLAAIDRGESADDAIAAHIAPSPESRRPMSDQSTAARLA